MALTAAEHHFVELEVMEHVVVVAVDEPGYQLIVLEAIACAPTILVVVAVPRWMSFDCSSQQHEDSLIEPE